MTADFFAVGTAVIDRRYSSGLQLVHDFGYSRPMPKASESAEDYLERIHELIEEKGYARVVDIARSLRVRQASVTQMVKRLDQRGFVRYEKYRGLVLTQRGRGVARAVQRRHRVLEEFFRLLEVDELTALRDLEGIEHHLSQTSVRRIEALVRCLKKRPELVREVNSKNHGNKS